MAKNETEPHLQNSNMAKNEIEPHLQNSNVAKNETEPYRYFLHVEKLHVENQDVDKLHVENSDLNNNNSTNNELNNNEGERESAHTQNFSNSQKPKPSKTKKPPSKKVAPKKAFPAKLSFEQSPYFEFEKFEELLSQMGSAALDAEHYHTKILLNAQAKGLQQSDWKAYIQNWIYEDKLAGKLVWKKQAASVDNKQSEISHKLDQISQDLAAGVFSSSEALYSILDTLRQFWKEANDANRDKMETLAQAIKIALESLVKESKEITKLKEKVKNTKPLQNKLKDRLRSIKPIDDSS